jgi:delta-aminolevulinic acid dehydratase/porphobilinogen synthase
MPGVERVSVDLLLPTRNGGALGVPAMALFPVVDGGLKDRRAPKRRGTRTAWCRARCRR